MLGGPKFILLNHKWMLKATRTTNAPVFFPKFDSVKEKQQQRNYKGQTLRPKAADLKTLSKTPRNHTRPLHLLIFQSRRAWPYFFGFICARTQLHIAWRERKCFLRHTWVPLPNLPNWGGVYVKLGKIEGIIRKTRSEGKEEKNEWRRMRRRYVKRGGANV